MVVVGIQLLCRLLRHRPQDLGPGVSVAPAFGRNGEQPHERRVHPACEWSSLGPEPSIGQPKTGVAEMDCGQLRSIPDNSSAGMQDVDVESRRIQRSDSEEQGNGHNGRPARSGDAAPGDDIGQVRFERMRQHDEIEVPAQSADQLAMYPFHSTTAGEISDNEAHNRTDGPSHNPDRSCRHGSSKPRLANSIRP